MNLSKFKKILVLKGGFSDESEISMQSGNEVSKVLRKKYEVFDLVVNNNIKTLVGKIYQCKPDAIFNALHGKFGEDGQIQSILNTIGIPYSHSGVMSSALAMNKFFSKIIFQKFGINCPNGEKLKLENLKKYKKQLPIVIKPISGGSSIGVKTIQESSSLRKVLEEVENKKDILIEEFIPGREITVGVLKDEICGITEIVSDSEFYDYKNKYVKIAKHIQNPNISNTIREKLIQTTVLAHNLLGCNCISRADYRYNESKNEIFLLEINTQPGLTKNSLLPEMAQDKGINFQKLVEIIIENSKCENYSD